MQRPKSGVPRVSDSAGKILKNKEIDEQDAPLSTGIFSATCLLQKKYGEREVRTHDLMAGNKKIQVPARVRTQDLQPDCATIFEVTKCINGVEIKWSFGKISLKNASQNMHFLPHLCGRKITMVENKKRRFFLYSHPQFFSENY